MGHTQTERQIHEQYGDLMRLLVSLRKNVGSKFSSHFVKASSTIGSSVFRTKVICVEVQLHTFLGLQLCPCNRNIFIKNIILKCGLCILGFQGSISQNDNIWKPLV
jgi:hypothetical protein